MNDKRNALLAGLVIVIAMALGGYFFLASKKSSLDEGNSQAYYALMTDAAGINAKSLITVAGLQVGEIRGIQLVAMPLTEFMPDLVNRSVDALNPTVRNDENGMPVRLVTRHDDFDGLVASLASRGRLPAKDQLAAEVSQRQSKGELKDDDAAWAYATNRIEVAAKALLTEVVRVARVDARINSDVKLPRDTWVRKESLGVLGAKAMFLDLGASSELLKSGDRIVNVRSLTGTDALLSQAENIVSDVRSITKKVDRDVAGITSDIRGITGELNRFISGDENTKPLSELYTLVMTDLRKVSGTIDGILNDARKLVKDNDSEFKSLVANVNRISGEIADLMSPGGSSGSSTPGAAVAGGKSGGSADGVPAAPSDEGDLRATMRSVRTIAADLTDVTSQIKALMGQNGDKVGSGITQLQETITELNNTLSSLSEVAGRVERGEGTVGRLLTDEKIADKVESAISGASDFVTQLTSLETHVDVGSWYNFNRGLTTTTLSLKLQPKPDKFYLLEIADDGGRLERFTETAINGTETRTSVREEDNSIRITAMFAKRFFDLLVLRAGLIENTGGVGANIFLFDNRLEFRSDVFGSRGPRDSLSTDPLAFYLPRWRSVVKAQPIPHFYVSAGIDDLLNVWNVENGSIRIYDKELGYGFDYFLGIGLTFKDDDLRSILPFIPGS